MSKLKENYMKPIRHGDVILKPVAKTTGKTLKHKGSYTLAYGEKTGHHHTLKSGKFKVLTEGERRYLEVEVEAILTHQEHNQLTVKPGKYEIVIQQEFDYELQSARRVQD